MSATTKIAVEDWGTTPEGEPVRLFILSNDAAEVRIATYGATLTAVRTPDRNGKRNDIILGSDTLQPYLAQPRPYLGSIVGRYANRIAKGQFSLDGQSFQVPCNNGVNSLHGGPVGFDQKLWSPTEVPGGVLFVYTSPHGEMGFPGTLTVEVTYTLVERTLSIAYTASTDQATVVNLTNHAFWNLDSGSASIAGHLLTLHADSYTPVDSRLIPTGSLDPVQGTPLDFTKPRDMAALWDDSFEQVQRAGGFDHNWVVGGDGSTLREIGFVSCPASGRTLTVHTTEPGVQFYSGNFLNASFSGREGFAYPKRSGFCLETQHFPDSPNHDHFPSTVLKPRDVLHSTTTYTFGSII